MTLYETLGVDLKATYAQIKHAYRKLAKTKHPDVGGTAEEFDVIKLAYDVLSSTERRKRYDETGDTAEAQIIDERGQMYAALASMIFDAIQQIDPRTNDIILAVRKRIVEERKKLSNDLSRMKKLKQMAESCASRIIQRSGGDENPLKLAVQNRIMSLDTQMKASEEGIEFGERMLQFLSTYAYNFDTLPSQLYGNGNWAYNHQQNVAGNSALKSPPQGQFSWSSIFGV